MTKKIVTGNMNGEVIYREETAEDRLQKVIAQYKWSTPDHDCHLSSEDSCDCQKIKYI